MIKPVYWHLRYLDIKAGKAKVVPHIELTLTDEQFKRAKGKKLVLKVEVLGEE